MVKLSRFRRGGANFENYNNVRPHRAIGRRTPRRPSRPAPRLDPDPLSVAPLDNATVRQQDG
jgi:hypothetical protein